LFQLEDSKTDVQVWETTNQEVISVEIDAESPIEFLEPIENEEFQTESNQIKEPDDTVITQLEENLDIEIPTVQADVDLQTVAQEIHEEPIQITEVEPVLYENTDQVIPAEFSDSVEEVPEIIIETNETQNYEQEV